MKVATIYCACCFGTHVRRVRFERFWVWSDAAWASAMASKRGSRFPSDSSDAFNQLDLGFQVAQPRALRKGGGIPFMSIGG
jgi:hypothetical protein